MKLESRRPTANTTIGSVGENAVSGFAGNHQADGTCLDGVHFRTKKISKDFEKIFDNASRKVDNTVLPEPIGAIFGATKNFSETQLKDVGHVDAPRGNLCG